mmetsp:Transcript_55833/g.122315  ORF Transcript_55833/g.122315 Transcript_55833/m.122315 type:complete len:253 (+) Transcript_55833:866-1624(+)
MAVFDRAAATRECSRAQRSTVLGSGGGATSLVRDWSAIARTCACAWATSACGCGASRCCWSCWALCTCCTFLISWAKLAAVPRPPICSPMGPMPAGCGSMLRMPSMAGIVAIIPRSNEGNWGAATCCIPTGNPTGCCPGRSDIPMHCPMDPSWAMGNPCIPASACRGIPMPMLIPEWSNPTGLIPPSSWAGLGRGNWKAEKPMVESPWGSIIIGLWIGTVMLKGHICWGTGGCGTGGLSGRFIGLPPFPGVQ